MPVRDPGLRKRRGEPPGVGPGVLGPANAAPLAHVENGPDARVAQGREERLGAEAVDADRGDGGCAPGVRRRVVELGDLPKRAPPVLASASRKRSVILTPFADRLVGRIESRIRNSESKQFGSIIKGPARDQQQDRCISPSAEGAGLRQFTVSAGQGEHAPAWKSPGRCTASRHPRTRRYDRLPRRAPTRLDADRCAGEEVRGRTQAAVEDWSPSAEELRPASLTKVPDVDTGTINALEAVVYRPDLRRAY